jgi:hypothetical protein
LLQFYFFSAANEIDTSTDFWSLKSQLSHILDAFTITSGNLSFSSESVRDLILNHQRLKPLEKSTLISQLSLIALMLTKFASSQFVFLSLSKEDQFTLLKNNIPLYLQYIMARYFSADNGLEQINWILEGQIYIDSIEEVTQLCKIRLREYNATVCMFPMAGDVDMYSHFCDNIGLFYPFPQHCNGLIANMLLYYTNESMVNELRDAKRISCIFEQSKELIKLGYRHLDRTLRTNPGNNIAPLIHTLERMQSIFETCKVHSDSGDFSRPIPKPLAVNFTKTEDNWIKLQFNLFQTQFQSVVPTQEYLDDAFRLLLRQGPVSEKYMTNWMSMMLERFRRVIRFHPELEHLSARDHYTLWEKNKMNALTLSAVRINLLKTGKDQLRDVFGVVDRKNTEWESEFSPTLDLSILRSTYLDENDLTLGRVDEPGLRLFSSIVNEVSRFCYNDQMYQLMTLITLLDVDGLDFSSGDDGILQMRQTYLKFFQRKLRAADCSFVDYSTFRQTLEKVKILADLMNTIYVHPQRN